MSLIAPKARLSPLAGRIRTLVVIVLMAMIVLVSAWLFSQKSSATVFVVIVLATLPLWLPLYGLVRGQRRTYAWATLCVIPYFVLGATEAVANPSMRAWSGACLALALLAFVLLIGYLRVTRGQ